MPKTKRPAAKRAPARSREGATRRPKWEFHALTPDRWAELVALFGPRGACAGCWCMFPRLTTAEWKTERASNRRAFQRIVRAGDPPGLLAYEDGRPVGWVAVAPRQVYRRFERSRI